MTPSILPRVDLAPVVAMGTALLLLFAPPVFAHGEDAHSDHSDAPHHEDAHGHEAATDDHGDHLAERDGFRVVHGWTNAGSGDRALVFMEFQNTGTDTVTVTGAEAEIAGSATLVGFRLLDGAPTYEHLPSVPLSAGRKMQLAPNGLAIELHGLEKPLHEGDHFDLELHTSIGQIDVHVDVEAADAMQHSHAGHAH